MQRASVQKQIRLRSSSPGGGGFGLAGGPASLLDSYQGIAIVGVVVLAVFITLSVRKAARYIEQDITTRTSESLADARWGWARVGVSGRDLRVSGTAPDAAQRRELLALLSETEGVRRIRDETAVRATGQPASPAETVPEAPAPAEPPAPAAVPARRQELVIVFDGSSLTLEGDGGDRIARERLLRLAQARYTERGVGGELRLSDDTPPGWIDAAHAGMEALALLDEGRVVLLGNVISVYGTAPDATAAARVRAGLRRRLPEGYITRVSLTRAYEETRLDAASCQAAFDALLARLHIEFDTASARISDRSVPVLNDLATIARRCPDAEIEIAGHTDDQGTRSDNLRLSQARAEAVMELLVQNGVELRRLVARGYGEERPITDNSTLEARARNRRIELNVMGVR